MRIKGTREIKGRYTKEKKENHTIKNEDLTNLEEEKKPDEIGCFKLVVIEKLPWYKKVIRTIGRLFRKSI